MQSEVKVSIIVPCRNEIGYIEDFLKNFFAQEGIDESFEVVISDGMSNDGTRDAIERYSSKDDRVRLIDNPELFTPFALNRAIEEARGEIIIRMDVHTEYAEDYVIQCVRTLNETDATCVGGPWMNKGKGYFSEAIAAAYESPISVGGGKAHDSQHSGPVDTVVFGCWKKQSLIDLGGFDNRLIRNQDDELNLRIHRTGGTVWQSTAIKCWYSPRNSLKNLYRQYQQYGFWKVLVIRIHKIPASIRHLVPALFVLSTSTLAAVLLLSILFGMQGNSNITIIKNISAILLSSEMALYLGLVLYASLKSIPKGSARLFPVMPLVFMLFHLGYGIGFLKGIWVFLVQRKETVRSGMSGLTR